MPRTIGLYMLMCDVLSKELARLRRLAAVGYLRTAQPHGMFDEAAPLVTSLSPEEIGKVAAGAWFDVPESG
jgi:hypothetical protein